MSYNIMSHHHVTSSHILYVCPLHHVPCAAGAENELAKAKRDAVQEQVAPARTHVFVCARAASHTYTHYKARVHEHESHAHSTNYVH
jgi:hypothetical protein